MGTYVVTGSASGMGAAIVDKMVADGHEVIGVDRAESADVVADLSTRLGRDAAIAELLERIDGQLHGVVCAAGLGPKRGQERTILEVNTLGVLDLLTAMRPVLAATDGAKVVVFGSNSTTSTPLVPRSAIRRILAGDAQRAAAIIRRRGSASGAIAYATSKLAVTRWCRISGVGADWAGNGINVNVLAPGPVRTPLLEAQLAGRAGNQVRALPVPIGRWGTAEQLADWALLMLSPSAAFACGSVITVDGGTEALLRGREWPRGLPLRKVPNLMAQMRSQAAHRRDNGAREPQ